jgi:pimeloyl-ACP methyl ester carboxylesterase
MKPLSASFHTIFIDIIGMGCSSRSDYDKSKPPAQIVDYFMRFIESWRLKRGISGFYLAAHSFGGYLSALYTVRYPQHVRKLMLVSSIGLMEKPADFDLKKIEVVPLYDAQGNKIQNKGPAQVHLRYMWNYLFENKRGPS